MSAFITSAGTFKVPLKGVNQNDDILQEPAYRSTEPATATGLMQDVDILWTRSSFAGMMSDTDSGLHYSENPMSQWWEWYWPPTGCHVRKLVTGTVKDVNGNPVIGATVQLFNTATGLLVDTQTSQADGSYRAGDPNAVACFAVGYLPNAPDTAGTTVNTITGT